MNNISSSFMFHEKLSVGPENNFQKSMNCQLIILYGLLNSDNNIYKNLFIKEVSGIHRRTIQKRS